MGCPRASVLRLWPVGQAAALDQRSRRSAALPSDAVAVQALAVLAGSRKRSWRWAASAGLSLPNRPPPLSLPSLRAAPAYTPSRHLIPPASAALPPLLLKPLGRQRSLPALPPLAAA